MEIEEISAYSFFYKPFDNSFPIKSCEIIIYAKNRKEAELIALRYNWKFFDESATVVVTEKGLGYRQT